jgi:hypothetical protein
MIKEYICEKINIVTIYCKVQIYFTNDSNNCKTWWNTKLYIECEFIVPFQLQFEKFDSCDFTKIISTSFSFK